MYSLLKDSPKTAYSRINFFYTIYNYSAPKNELLLIFLPLAFVNAKHFI